MAVALDTGSVMTSEEEQYFLGQGRDALTFVAGKVVDSTNHPDRSLCKYRIKGKVTEEYLKHWDWIKDRREESQCTWIQAISVLGDQLSPLERAMLAAVLAEQTEVGNCFEISCAAMKYLMENSSIRRITLHALGKEHNFLSAGKGDVPNFNTDILIDGWSPEENCRVYPAREMSARLKNYVGFDEKTCRPILEPYAGEPITDEATFIRV